MNWPERTAWLIHFRWVAFRVMSRLNHRQYNLQFVPVSVCMALFWVSWATGKTAELCVVLLALHYQCELQNNIILASEIAIWSQPLFIFMTSQTVFVEDFTSCHCTHVNSHLYQFSCFWQWNTCISKICKCLFHFISTLFSLISLY